jgi:outer membrane immunogenic protein
MSIAASISRGGRQDGGVDAMKTTMTIGLIAAATIYNVMADTASAIAADLPLKAPITAPAVVYDWTGFYFGGHVGGGWTSSNAEISFPTPLLGIDPFAGSLGKSSALGGFQEGINWQFARTWVVGIEGDWSYFNVGHSISQTLTFNGGTPIPLSSGSLSTKLDWLASARNRLGYLAMPNLLVYGTGGVAWGKITDSGAAALNNNFGFTYASNVAPNNVAVGWVAGGGLEWMLANHWLLRGEYLYYHLSSGQNAASNNPLSFKGLCIIGECPPPSATINYSWSNMNVNVLRAALSYKF